MRVDLRVGPRPRSAGGLRVLSAPKAAHMVSVHGLRFEGGTHFGVYRVFNTKCYTLSELDTRVGCVCYSLNQSEFWNISSMRIFEFLSYIRMVLRVGGTFMVQ